MPKTTLHYIGRRVAFPGSIAQSAAAGQILRDDRRYAIAATELGWKPSATFEDGICDTVAWYLANAAWVDRVQSGAYRRERLGVNV